MYHTFNYNNLAKNTEIPDRDIGEGYLQFFSDVN